MILESKLVCVQIYPVESGESVEIIPGRNMISDRLGRMLMKRQGFLDMLNTKAPRFAGKLRVIVPPAPTLEEARATAAAGKGGKGGKGKKAPEPVVGDSGLEAATANLSITEAIKAVREADIVDQLQQISLLDPRPEVKEACEKRIEQLAQLAREDAGKSKDNDNGGPDDGENDEPGE